MGKVHPRSKHKGASPSLEGFGKFADDARRAWGVPGMAIAAVKDDRVVLSEGFGVRRAGARDAVDDRTLFNVGSNTKAMTVAALGLLKDEGRLLWDDRVVAHLPSFRVFDRYVTRKATIRDLLSHRIGLPGYGGDIMWWGSIRSQREILKRVARVRPTFGFRDGYGYQNIMYIAAGRIVRRASGMPWHAFLEQRLFKPLGMGDTTARFAELVANTNRATPHMLMDGDKPLVLNERNLDNGGPATGVISNARDMAQWLRFQLNRGVVDKQQLLSKAALEAAWSPVNNLPLSPTLQKRAGTNFHAYGMGWRVLDFRGHRMVYHGGWTDGMYSAVAMLPDRHTGVVVLTNLHNRDLSFPMALEALDHLLGTKNRDDWSGIYLGYAKEDEEKARKNDAAAEHARATGGAPTIPPKACEGAFENEVYGDLSVILNDDGTMVVQLNHSPTFVADLQHWQVDTYKAVWRDPVAKQTLLTFALDNRGRLQLRLQMTDFIDPAVYVFKRKRRW